MNQGELRGPALYEQKLAAGHVAHGSSTGVTMRPAGSGPSRPPRTMNEPADGRPEGEHLTSLHIRQAIRNDRASVGWLVARFTPLLLCQAHQRMAASLRRFCD